LSLSNPTITYTARADASAQAELDASVTIYRFLLLKKGDRHDLTSKAATEAEGVSQDRKGQDSDVCC
jgi:hypothetical protein